MFAALAQLVERRLGKAEVGSSNLLGSLNHEAFRNIREAFFVLQGIPPLSGGEYLQEILLAQKRPAELSPQVFLS